jgi:hypothetical protein
MTVTNSIFNGNNAWVGGVDDGSAYMATNCTFNGNWASNYSGVAADLVSGTVTNCIFAGGNDDKFSNIAGDMFYCDVDNGDWDSFTTTECISGDPLFVSTKEADPQFLRLTGGSPCIDTASIEAPSTDITGEIRPRGFGNDMGAYEFQGPSISVEAPNGGGPLKTGISYQIQWETSAESTVNIKVWLSTDEGTNWGDTPITEESWSHPAGISTYEWTPLQSMISTECLISVEVSGEISGIQNYDASNAVFEIRGPKTFYVDSISPEGGEGSQDSPFNTINSAEAAAFGGDEIHVKQGTYDLYQGGSGPNTINLKSGVYLRGGYRTDDWSSQEANPSTTIISGEDSVQCMSGTGLSAATTIENFTIENGLSSGGSGGGLYLTGSSPTIQNCIFTSNEAQWGGGIRNDSSFPTITNCILL